MSGAGGRDHASFDRGEAASRARDSERALAAREDDAAAPRDMTPALGTPAEPAWAERAPGDAAPVALHVGQWRDGRWSYLYGADTRYAPAPGAASPVPGRDSPRTNVEGQSPDKRGGTVPRQTWRGARDEEPRVVSGPMIHAPVWTWEIPLYFWFGGIAAGSSFVALACDLAGDEKSARIARRVALCAVTPSPLLLVMDLGRPARFLNMLRIFKPRSPMSMGAWCLVAFSGLASAAVGADLLGRKREARLLGGANAVVGGYLGSYTGVLLATTAVPLWARSRLFLGPIFVTTGAATGAAACRLTLIASGLPEDHPTRHALGRVETAAMTTELVLSVANEKRLGELGETLEHGRHGVMFRWAKRLVRTGLALRFVRHRTGRPAHDVASVLYLAAGLLFRYAWVGAGKEAARDDRLVAETARRRTERR